MNDFEASKKKSGGIPRSKKWAIGIIVVLGPVMLGICTTMVLNNGNTSKPPFSPSPTARPSATPWGNSLATIQVWRMCTAGRQDNLTPVQLRIVVELDHSEIDSYEPRALKIAKMVRQEVSPEVVRQGVLPQEVMAECNTWIDEDFQKLR